ncbi:MAG: transporter substrate-binding domain-containing protein [Deltaproteobacteria bacterium]|nr:MAG: transporter substrate-binding domain-containing protein [Deltaproteobacteria bacterium]
MKYIILLLFLPMAAFSQDYVDIDLGDVLDEEEKTTIIDKTKGEGGKDLPEVIFLMDKDYPPYMYLDKDKKIRGLYPSMIKEISFRMGINPKFEPLRWDKAVEEAKKGKKGLIGVYKSTMREKYFDFSEPYYDEIIRIYVLRGKEFPYERIQDLKFKTVGWKKGFSYGSRMDKARELKYFKVKERKTIEGLFDDLAAGKTNCLVIDEMSALRAQLNHEPAQKAKHLEMALAENSVYLAFGKQGKQKELIEKFNKGLLELQLEQGFSKMINNFIRDAIN